MDTPDDDQNFLRDLVKSSRQRPHHVEWVDRDGTSRQTALTQAEVVRLNAIAQRMKISKSEVLRRTAHTPVAARTQNRPDAVNPSAQPPVG